MQHQIYWGPLKKPVEWSLKTWLAPWAYVASVAYHDMFWYPFYGKARVEEALRSDWGRLFANWGKAQPDAAGRGYPDVGSEHPELVRTGLKHFAEGLPPGRHGRGREPRDPGPQASLSPSGALITSVRGG